MTNEGIRFGVNYVPSKNWWYCWTDWDKSAIGEDLSAIASMGMDHIRIHCLWPDFQPNPSSVNESVLNGLSELMDIAAKNNLDVVISVLDGWLSGFPFVPAWAYGKNIFTDEEVITAEKFLLKTIADKIGKHKSFYGLDIGNEINVLAGFGHYIPANTGDKWAAEMLDFCDKIAPGRIHVNGTDHAPWFGDAIFSRKNLAVKGAMTTVHAWTFFAGVFSKFKPLEVGSVHFAEFMIELANAYREIPSRKVWLQEFGASNMWMDQRDMPVFAEQTIRNALSCDNLWGVTWWCSHDIDRKFSGFVELEYELGLLDTNNNLKPVGRIISDFIAEYRKNPVTFAEKDVAIILPERIFGESGGGGWEIADAFFNCIRQGIRPVIVPEDKAKVPEYLAERGIKSLLDI